MKTGKAGDHYYEHSLSLLRAQCVSCSAAVLVPCNLR